MRRVAVYTHDLHPGMEHLIPWRILVEWACNLKESGYEVRIMSGISQPKSDSWEYNGINILYAPKPSRELAAFLNSKGTDMLFWPVTWFVNKKSYKILTQINATKVAYFPGGIYKLHYIIRAFSYVDTKSLLPYFIESVFPKRITVKILTENSIAHIICFTELTAKNLIKNGWAPKKVTYIYPGFDEIQAPGDESKFNKHLKTHDSYFLFMGSASPVRGSLFLLDTIEKYKFPSNLKFIFLIRNDLGVSQSDLDGRIKKGNLENCLFITEKLSKAQLYPFIKNARAVVLPFLIIPSEVPVTFYEVLNIGKPIISLENGGTTDHLKKYIFIAGNTKRQLAHQINQCLTNEEIYNQKIQNIQNDFKGNFTWKNFADKFKQLTRYV